jgi:hypothetical protein
MLFKIFDPSELDVTVESMLVSFTFKFSYAYTIDF